MTWKLILRRVFKANEENLGGETSEKMLPKKDRKRRLFPHSPLASRPRIVVQLKSSGSYLGASGKHLKKNLRLRLRK